MQFDMGGRWWSESVRGAKISLVLVNSGISVMIIL